MNNKKRKTVSVKKTMLLFVLITIASMTNIYAQEFTVGKLKYKVRDEGKSVVVLGHLDGQKAKGNLVVPETVTYKNTTYPVTCIENFAFEECKGLTSVTIGDSVTTIGVRAFSYCSSLVSVHIPNTVTLIESGVFCGCEGLTSIVIPNSVTSIGKDAFYGCSGFVGDLIIPNSVALIGEGAFWECTGFDHIIVEYGNTVYDSRGDCNAIIQTATNNLILGCKNTVIPTSITTIEAGAFVGCEGLTTITIPNSVTSIGGAAFSSCRNLMSLSIPNSVTTIGTNAFSRCSNLMSLNIPNSVTTIGAYAFWSTGWYNKQQKGVLYLDNCCLGYKYEESGGGGTVVKLQEILRKEGPQGQLRLKEGTRLIANMAFFSCVAITSIYIPNSVISIGDEAFKYCDGLTSVVIPKTVTSLGYSVFSYCKNLNSVIIENPNLRDYSFGNFWGCNNLNESNVIYR